MLFRSGPPLHHVRLGGSKLARAQASSSALASKLAAVVGTEHVPKRHSPLASPSITGEPDDREGEDLRLEEAEGTLEIIRDERGQVEKELSEAEGTGMDLGLLLEASRPLSPCGSPEHQEVSTYLSLHQDSSSLFSTGIPWNDGSPAPLAGPSSSQPIPSPQILDFDEGFASSSPPRHSPAFQAVVSHGPEGDTLFAASEITVDAERTDLVASGAPQVPLAEPCAALLVGSDYRALGFMDVDGPSALGLETGVAPGVENEQELAIDEESLSSLERIFVCAKSETTEERFVLLSLSFVPFSLPFSCSPPYSPPSFGSFSVWSSWLTPRPRTELEWRITWSSGWRQSTSAKPSNTFCHCWQVSRRIVSTWTRRRGRTC